MEPHGNTLSPRKFAAVRDRLLKQVRVAKIIRETGVSQTKVYAIKRDMKARGEL